tara:strand:- start:6121 stop:7956 length:1836 start_codon:yes stop_codon:yes gene_type:complete
MGVSGRAMGRKTGRKASGSSGGKLRIGDDWNAITIIALSQSNPLKAVAEFVENSIDARSRNITITRGKEHGQHYLKVTDDGEGIPRNSEGIPDFRYVATHICDSVKKRIKADGAKGIQGEFGIGLLSFWTLGEDLSLTCAGEDGQTYQMGMKRGDSNYSVSKRRVMIPDSGTELKVTPMLAGIRSFSGEKIQWYLASELRDRIRQSGVFVRVVDRTARKEFKVEPRAFDGQLLHQLPVARTGKGDIYLELYLGEPSPERKVGLYRAGTRVLETITELDAFKGEAWASGHLEGIVDAPFMNLTPGTRSGIIQDEFFAEVCTALKPVEESLLGLIEEQRKAAEERANRQTLRTIQKAFREALLSLPVEEYDWFDIRAAAEGRAPIPGESASGLPMTDSMSTRDWDADEQVTQKQFFDFAGPLHSVRISPASCVVSVGKSRTLRAIARDRRHRLVEQGVTFLWEITAGSAELENPDGEIVTLNASPEPGLTHVRVTVQQRSVSCQAEALVTVTDSLLPENRTNSTDKEGLPGYTFQRAPGELWRSRYDPEQNIIVINNGHRDFVFASRTRALQLRYICRLFAKELVVRNFPGHPPNELLERMIELSLYTEEYLK